LIKKNINYRDALIMKFNSAYITKRSERKYHYVGYKTG